MTWFVTGVTDYPFQVVEAVDEGANWICLRPTDGAPGINDGPKWWSLGAIQSLRPTEAA